MTVQADPQDTATPVPCPRRAWNEADRFAALDRYAILDTGREPAFDEVAALAAELLDAPVALVNFVAADHKWFKAEVGIGRDELPRDVSICRHAILQPGVLVVPDLSRDARFAENPLVQAIDGLRFYASALLETPEGLPLGTVCVLDRAPRPGGIAPRQERALRALTAQTMAQIELRAERRRAEARERIQPGRASWTRRSLPARAAALGDARVCTSRARHGRAMGASPSRVVPMRAPCWSRRHG